MLRAEGQKFKDEIINDLAAAGEKTVSTYRQGDFLDLCRGPHVPSTGKIKAFKLLTVAGGFTGAAMRTKQQLTRIYGTAFFDKKDLDKYVQLAEEAGEARSSHSRPTSSGSVHH